MIGIFIFFAIFLRDKGFLSGVNVMNIFRQTAVISILAIGFTFLLTSAEFDLSIGSTTALAALGEGRSCSEDQEEEDHEPRTQTSNRY